jgi:thiol:disulfide interchange protein DsbD
MESVKSIGGIALLWAALYFLRPLVRDLRMFASPELWFLLSAAGAFVVGLLIGGVKLSFHGPAAHKLRKGLGVALMVLGAYAAWDWKQTPKQRLPWVYSEEIAFQRAKAEGKGVMVDYSATWCIPCEELELTFGDDEVYDAITASFVPLKLDVTDDNAETDKLKKRYGAGTLPSVVFLDTRVMETRGQFIVLGRLKKLVEPDEMMRILRPMLKQLREPPAPPAPPAPASASAPTPAP